MHLNAHLRHFMCEVNNLKRKIHFKRTVIRVAIPSKRTLKMADNYYQFLVATDNGEI